MVNLTRKILPGIARMIPVVHCEVNGGFKKWFQKVGFKKWWQCARSGGDGQMEADSRCALHASGEDRPHTSANEQSASGTIKA
jgi:hypothetical protein